MVSHPKTHAFTAWNPWFRKPKVSTMKSVRKREQKMIDCYFTKITQIFDYGWVLEDGAQRPRPTEVCFVVYKYMV